MTFCRPTLQSCYENLVWMPFQLWCGCLGGGGGGGGVVHLISDSIVANHSQNGFVERIASFFNDIQEAQNLT